ncbi:MULTISPECIES: hypothetical protein [Streptomyces]|uniref:DUF3558 domain-containing protein n=1 Tax=Streptomyces albus TaxID=1888 RepID=A0A8H1QVT4_9ACTN|nr:MULTISPECIES: hypothetical protein [Streptomyces]TGG84718.1 hypothetical protein D8771_12835 [Streptomyces albus]UVN56220.1 hypothetical protein NR995_18125 [Streptomyces albus]
MPQASARPGVLRRKLLRTALCAALLAAIAGCGHGREYTVPDSLCGTRTDPDLLGALLPRGAGVHVSHPVSREEGREKGSVCSVSVKEDEDASSYSPAVRVQWDIVPGDRSAEDLMKVKDGRARAYGNPRESGLGKLSLLADHGLVVVASCPGEGNGVSLVLDVEVSTDTPEDVDKRRTTIERFGRQQLKSVLREQGCTG